MANPLSIDPVPILPTSFLDLVDKRTVGKAVFFTEEYQISAPPPLPEEQPDPSVGEVRLRECPEHDVSFPIFISGYSEVSSTPSASQFSVDYKNGVLSFPVAAIGTNVTISYYGLGSIVMAADVNNITAQLTPFFNKLNGGDDLGLLRRTTVLATSGQTVFTAGFPVSPTETMVYSQGLLMTPGGLADYIVGGPGVSGTSISDTSHFISLSGGTLTINLNNDGPRTITLGTDATGADISADIQIQIRALTAITGGNQAAYNSFTATYNSGTGLYTLTSGTTGIGSTVVVTGASDAALLELGLAYSGVEAAGTAGAGSGYALLASVGITGSAGTTPNILTVNGDVDISPNTSSSITNFPPSIIVGGVERSDDSVAIAAKAAALADFAANWGTYPTPADRGTLITAGTLDGFTMDQSGATPGVYYASSTATLATSGDATLTFAAPGTYIIAVDSALHTGAGGMPTMAFTSPATPSNTTIKWYIGSAATINEGVSSAGGVFYGSVNAYAAVTVTKGGIINGSLAATGPSGAITFSDTGAPTTVYGPPSATAGTSISETASIPVTTTSGGVLLISVDGVTFQPIILAANVTGAAIAADIQAKVRALPSPTPGEVGFTATYNGDTGLYTLTSGTVGTSSTAVVLKASNDITLKLGLTASGTETAGSAGASVSGSTPATSIAGGTLTFNLNGDGLRTITLAASGDTTGILTAADIQFKVRALTANNPLKQTAYTNFTAAYITVYTLTSGTVGTGSSIIVSAGSDRAALKLGASYGTETAGVSGSSISNSSPALTSATGDTLTINLNGDGFRIITLGVNSTGAAVAADIQAKVRALLAITPSYQAAYTNFTAVYSGGLYTLTAGVTPVRNSVVVAGTSPSIDLALGLFNGGAEIIGAPGSNQITFNTPRYSGEIINFINIGI